MKNSAPALELNDLYIVSDYGVQHEFKNSITDELQFVLIRVDGLVDTQDAVGFVVLVENLYPSLFAIFLSDSLKVSYDESKYGLLLETISQSLEDESLICVWTHFRTLSACRDIFGEFVIEAKSPVSEPMEIINELDIVEDRVLNFNLKYAKFSADDGNWMSADSVALGIFKVLKDQGVVEKFVRDFPVELKKHMEVYFPETCGLFPNHFYL